MQYYYIADFDGDKLIKHGYKKSKYTLNCDYNRRLYIRRVSFFEYLISKIAKNVISKNLNAVRRKKRAVELHKKIREHSYPNRILNRK